MRLDRNRTAQDFITSIIVAAMLTFVILAFLFLAGWVRWPWWTPRHVRWSCAADADADQVDQCWRGEAGLTSQGPPEALAILIVTFFLYGVAFGLGVGASRLFRDG